MPEWRRRSKIKLQKEYDQGSHYRRHLIREQPTKITNRTTNYKNHRLDYKLGSIGDTPRTLSVGTYARKIIDQTTNYKDHRPDYKLQNGDSPSAPPNVIASQLIEAASESRSEESRADSWKGERSEIKDQMEKDQRSRLMISLFSNEGNVVLEMTRML